MALCYRFPNSLSYWIYLCFSAVKIGNVLDIVNRGNQLPLTSMELGIGKVAERSQPRISATFPIPSSIDVNGARYRESG